MADPNGPGIRARLFAIFLGVVALLISISLDLVAALGCALVTYGVGIIYRPAAFIVCGLFLLGTAWLLARNDRTGS